MMTAILLTTLVIWIIKECKHKDVFPLEISEYFASLLIGVIIALCNTAGIGGGGLIVPSFMVLGQFSTKESVALSNAVIFFGCIVRYFLNFKRRHPLKQATTIDNSIVMVMLPMVMLGSIIGVQANILLPEIILMVMLASVLLFLVYKTGVKAIKTRRKENEAIHAAQEEEKKESKGEEEEDIEESKSLKNKAEQEAEQEVEKESENQNKSKEKPQISSFPSIENDEK
jgi:hypothetical protein